MKYPLEISNITFNIVYRGRSTSRFQFGKQYRVTYVYGEQRGCKSNSLDYHLLDSGYRVLPYEYKKYWRYEGIEAVLVLRILYGRQSTTFPLKDLVYKRNPFLTLLKNQHFSVPIVYDKP